MISGKASSGGWTGPLRELSHTWFIFDWRSHLALPLCQARLPTHVSAFANVTCYFDTIHFNVFCDGIALLRRPSQLFGKCCASGADSTRLRCCDLFIIFSFCKVYLKQHITHCWVCACICLHCQLSTLGGKNEEGGIENVSCSIYSRIKPDECFLVVTNGIDWNASFKHVYQSSSFIIWNRKKPFWCV